MSKLFDALKRSERERAPSHRSDSDAQDGDRRRSRRRVLGIPVYVYVHEPDEGPFHEETYTLNVNAEGALLLLSVPVREGQTLLLTNALTQQDQDCRVVRLGTRRSRTIEAGVTFPYPNPGFWSLAEETKPAATE